MSTTYKLPIEINGRPPMLVDSGFNTDIRFDPDSDSPTYIGLNVTNGASTADASWKIYKFASTRIQVAYGAWDDRVSLF